MAEHVELNLYGDYAQWLVERGMKQLTLRRENSKYDSFQPGKDAIIRYDEGVGIGIIFGRQTKPLGEFTEAELLLDGFWSHEEAIESLRQYPGYENVTLKTKMLGIAFAAWSYFNSYLTKEQRELIVETPLAEAVKMAEFGQYFLPCYLGWAVLKFRDAGANITVARWHKVLTTKGLVDPERLKAVIHVDKATEKFYKGLTAKKIKMILDYESTVSAKYQSLVVCKPVSVS